MFNNTDVCAVIITYNCTEIINNNIESLCKQTGHILVIDNGSDDKSLKLLDRWKTNQAVTIMNNKVNEGLALRLNEALEWVMKKKYPFILTMDQDTVLEQNCVNEMLEIMNTVTDISSVGPNRKKHLKESYLITDYLITSGNLLITKDAYEVGGFFSDLFIDLIDIEFSLRMKKNGKRMAIAKKAKMNHKVGEYETKKVLGKEYRYLSHSPQRYYYIYRNHVIVTKMYVRYFPMFIFKMLFFLSLDTLKMQFEKNSMEKRKAAWKGLMDGIKYE